MKKPVPRCECCGASLLEYKQTMTKRLARVLLKIVKHHIHTSFPLFKFSSSGEYLTVNESAALHCLKYWDLIAKPPGEEPAKGGDWMVTRKGMDFLTGKIAIPKAVTTYRKEVVRSDPELIFIEQATGGWKHKPDYLDEAMLHYPKEEPEQGKLL